MSGEKLKLVTDFGQLRAGDLVVIKPCGHCGKTHRGMLGSQDDGMGIDPDGQIGQFVSWELLGQSHVRSAR